MVHILKSVFRITLNGILLLTLTQPSSSVQNWTKASLLDLHNPLLHASLRHLGPATLRMSSDHLVWGLPTLLRPFLGLQSSTLLVHRSSDTRDTWPAQFHLISAILFATSVTPVFSLIHTFVLRSLNDMFNILRSIALCVTCSLCKSLLVRADVSNP